MGRGRAGERESQFHASFLPSFPPLSLLLRPAARGIREDVTFILQQFPSIHFAVFIGTAARGRRERGGGYAGSFWEAHSPRSLAALRQKTKRFPYQIPSSAFCAIRILGYYSNGLRARELLPRGGRVLSGGERSLAAAAKSFHILTTFK